MAETNLCDIVNGLILYQLNLFLLQNQSLLMSSGIFDKKSVYKFNCFLMRIPL